MHRLTANLRSVMFSFVLVLPSAVSSQENRQAPASAEASRQFAAIHASLDETAESILGSTLTKVANPGDRNNQGYKQPTSPYRSNIDQPSERAFSPMGMHDLIQSILVKEGVPEDLAAVVFIESGGNPLALSSKGARGLWQLMPDTARRYGLTVDPRRDDRLDIEKSTVTAARYLRDLYLQFESWPLALAAYNTGEQHVLRAMARSGSREFETLSSLKYLPAETRHYVPAVLAAMRSSPGFTFSRPKPAQGAGLVFAITGQ